MCPVLIAIVALNVGFVAGAAWCAKGRIDDTE